MNLAASGAAGLAAAQGMSNLLFVQGALEQYGAAVDLVQRILDCNQGDKMAMLGGLLANMAACQLRLGQPAAALRSCIAAFTGEAGETGSSSASPLPCTDALSMPWPLSAADEAMEPGKKAKVAQRALEARLAWASDIAQASIHSHAVLERHHIIIMCWCDVPPQVSHGMAGIAGCRSQETHRGGEGPAGQGRPGAAGR